MKAIAATMPPISAPLMLLAELDPFDGLDALDELGKVDSFIELESWYEHAVASEMFPSIATKVVGPYGTLPESVAKNHTLPSVTLAPSTSIV